MKNILLAGLATILLFTSCKKTNDQPNFGSMNATIGTATMNSTFCYVSSDSRNFTFWGVFGSSLSQPLVEFNLYTFTGTLDSGVYDLDGIQNSASWDSSATNNRPAAYGTVSIASVNSKTITGTFSFTCKDSTKVTGSFTAGRR